MFRLLIICQAFLLFSCVTSRSIKHFASGKKLSIKKVQSISLFNGQIAIEELSDKKSKEPVYLLYKGDSLKFISNRHRITNNEFIYKVGYTSNSGIMLTRETMHVRYYMTDTVLFSANVAVSKRTASGGNQIVDLSLESYTFSNDSLNIISYHIVDDIKPIPISGIDFGTIQEKPGTRKEVRSIANQNKAGFFKQYLY